MISLQSIRIAANLLGWNSHDENNLLRLLKLSYNAQDFLEKVKEDNEAEGFHPESIDEEEMVKFYNKVVNG